jgi:mRNA interferase HigB
MRIINPSKHFPDFVAKHPDSESALRRWRQTTASVEWKTFADVRQTFGSASPVKDRVVFNIGGNKYRLIAWIDYEHGIVYLKHVLTHAEYDKGDWKRE